MSAVVPLALRHFLLTPPCPKRGLERAERDADQPVAPPYEGGDPGGLMTVLGLRHAGAAAGPDPVQSRPAPAGVLCRQPGTGTGTGTSGAIQVPPPSQRVVGRARRRRTHGSACLQPDGDAVVAQPGRLPWARKRPRSSLLRVAYQVIAARAPQGAKRRVTTALFSPDGQQVITSSADYTVRIWNAQTGAEQRFTGHAAGINAVAPSPSATQLATADLGADRARPGWDRKTSQADHVHRPYRQRQPIAFSGWQDLNHCQRRCLRLGYGTPRPAASSTPCAATARINSATLPDGRRSPRRATTGPCGSTMTAQRPGPFTPTGTARRSTQRSFQRWKTLLTASADQTAWLWDAQTGPRAADVQRPSAWVYSATFSPDGTHVLTASEDGTARIWDARLAASCTA